MSYTRQTKASIYIVEAVPPLSVTATRAVLVFVKRPQNDKSTHRDRPTATVPFSSQSAFVNEATQWTVLLSRLLAASVTAISDHADTLLRFFTQFIERLRRPSRSGLR